MRVVPVKMLKITPRDVIAFGKSGNELTGTVEITNINSASITYKVIYKREFMAFRSNPTDICGGVFCFR